MKLLRILLFKALYKTGIGHLLLKRNRKNSQIPILIFHKIIPEYDAIWPGIHPKLFEEIITLVKKNYTILPLHYLHSNPGMDFTNACFITFDDGYKDYLDYAHPILRKHAVHSTLFVLPFDLSNHGHIWTSTIIYFVKHYWFSDVRDFFISHNQHINFGDKLDDFSLNLAITKHFCTLQQEERRPIIETLQSKFVNDNRIIEKELLTFVELKKLGTDLVDIASHSLTHPSFKQETNENFITYEILESKKIIETQLDVSVSSFAFPFAVYNELALNTVKKYYKIGFTRLNDMVDLKKLKTDENYMYDLPRYNIHHDSAEEVFLLINGFHKKISKRFF